MSYGGDSPPRLLRKERSREPLRFANPAWSLCNLCRDSRFVGVLGEREKIVKRVGVSELRKMNATNLRALKVPVEIRHKNRPLRVLVPFTLFMEWQDEYQRLLIEAEKGKKP
jgi:hypothetical protein